jgi:tetratricopeptide (TPR) repeat protein
MAKVKKQKFKNIPLKRDRVTNTGTKKTSKTKKVVEVPKEFLTKSSESTEIRIEKETVVLSKNVLKEEEVIKTEEHAEYTKELSLDEENRQKGFFPKISRFITERWFVCGFLCGVLVVCIVIVHNTIAVNAQKKHDLEIKRQKIQQQISFWQENIRKYPDYRDGYFQLALLEYQLGDIQSAQSYLNKVESLDPNFQEAYQLEKLLQK